LWQTASSASLVIDSSSFAPSCSPQSWIASAAWLVFVCCAGANRRCSAGLRVIESESERAREIERAPKGGAGGAPAGRRRRA
jgi:hypothetical protein